MKIVINDANILIDLVKLELVDAFSELDFDLHTTDFVLEELNDEQKTPIINLNNGKKLQVIETIETADFLGYNNNSRKKYWIEF